MRHVWLERKQAKQVAPKVAKFCFAGKHASGVFMLLDIINKAGKLRWWLEKCKIGNYTVKEKCIRELVKIDVHTCTVENLEKIPGFGPKTARFFILHSRPNQKVACLDTHILKWLKEKGHDVPKASPQNPKTYARVENLFLDECEKCGKTPAQLDLEVWKSKARL